MIESKKKITVTSLTASQQPLFAVPEHMTHPVKDQVICIKRSLEKSNGKLGQLEKNSGTFKINVVTDSFVS